MVVTGGPHKPSWSEIDHLSAELASRWASGERPRVEEYLERLDPESDADAAVELIYRDYQLAEAAGSRPRRETYLERFPEHRGRLKRLFGLRDAIGDSLIDDIAGKPASLPEAGDEIGPYRLRRELGRGASAAVFLAEQVDLEGRLVVVKLTARRSAEPRLLARARHPHIVEVLRHAEVDDGALHLIVMPFLGGATLGAVLEEGRRRGRRPRKGGELLADLDRVAAPEFPAAAMVQPAREVLAPLGGAKAWAWVVARLAEALDHAHRRGVVHGDVKPSNVLLADDGRPMLFDFNLGVGDAGGHDPGGTPAYMAPERLRAFAGPSAPVDGRRADIYALGVVLCEALTGERPTAIATAGNMRVFARRAAEQRESGAPFSRSALRAIPGGLRPIVARCLAPDPLRRYDAAAELAADLDRFRADLSPMHADEPSPGVRALRWSRRRRRSLAAGGLMLLAGAFAAIGVSWHAGRNLEAQAVAKLESIWGGHEPGVFRFRRPGQQVLEEDGDPAELARAHLMRYGALGSEDWRLRDDVRYLPEAERADLGLWLLEQTWRMASALADRVDSPDDWRRGLAAVERVAAPRPGALERVAARLRKQLDRRPEGAAGAMADRCAEEYLAGIEEESASAAAALAHFRAALGERPASFWANYRAAAAAFRCGDFALAEAGLRRCLARRPANAVLRQHLAAALERLGRRAEALAECERALALDPDLAEIYLTRAMLRDGGDRADIDSDLRRARLLRASRATGSLWADLFGGSFGDVRAVGRVERLAPLHPEARTAWADWLLRRGDWRGAIDEYEKTLDEAPEHLRARFNYASALRSDVRYQHVGDAEFARLVEHPAFDELVAAAPGARVAYRFAAEHYLQGARYDDAIDVALMGVARGSGRVSYADHYDLARVFAVAGGSRPSRLDAARRHLASARALNAHEVDARLARDPLLRDLNGPLER